MQTVFDQATFRMLPGVGPGPSGTNLHLAKELGEDGDYTVRETVLSPSTSLPPSLAPALPGLPRPISPSLSLCLSMAREVGEDGDCKGIQVALFLFPTSPSLHPSGPSVLLSIDLSIQIFQNYASPPYSSFHLRI